MSAITDLMRAVGLGRTEAAVYLDLLPRPSTAREIAARTGIARPTVYHALETLGQKGLASMRKTAGRTTYSATDPARIAGLFDERIAGLAAQKKAVEALAPSLAKIAPRAAEAFAVEHYEGAEGVKAVVEEALYCRSGKWDIIAPRRNFFSEFDPAYARYFMQTRERRGIIARSLWERDPADRPRRMLTPAEIRARRPRYLPAVMAGAFRSVIIIFDDKVALISSRENLSAVLIRSKEVRDTMAALFEGLWSASTDYVEARGRK